MKIVLFINSISGGGAERVTSNLANYLTDYDNDITVITMSDIKDTYEVNKKVKRFYLLNNSERKNIIYDNFLRFKRLKQFMIENKDVDCYVTMLPITIFMLVSLKKYTNAKIIISERNNPQSYSLYNKLIMKYAEKKCDGLVVQTNHIANWYNVKNTIIIPNAINNNILIDKERKNIQNKIVSVGRLEKQKNYPMLIKAFSIFLTKHPEYNLEIYGQGTLEKKIKELCKKLNIENKVIFKGYLKNVNEMIYNAKMFVMTSNFEGMPNALIEAMCLGIPCIATDCDGGGARELIKNKYNGILIEKNDINSLVASMSMIASDNKLASYLSSNAITLKNDLEYNHIYSKWLKYISDVVSNN